MDAIVSSRVYLQLLVRGKASRELLGADNRDEQSSASVSGFTNAVASARVDESDSPTSG